MPKRVLQGAVVSDKGDKTVVVRVDRAYSHPLLKKVVRRSKRYHAHDEQNAYGVGDMVQLVECPPKSKLKHWLVAGKAGEDISAYTTPSPAAEALPGEGGDDAQPASA